MLAACHVGRKLRESREMDTFKNNPCAAPVCEVSWHHQPLISCAFPSGTSGLPLRRLQRVAVSHLTQQPSVTMDEGAGAGGALGHLVQDHLPQLIGPSPGRGQGGLRSHTEKKVETDSGTHPGLCPETSADVLVSFPFGKFCVSSTNQGGLRGERKREREAAKVPPHLTVSHR